MRTLWAVLAVALIGVLFVGAVATAEDENSAKTSGLSWVSWELGTEIIGTKTWHYYEWTLSNLTGLPLGEAVQDCNGKEFQVLVDKLSITKLLPKPAFAGVPDGWVFKENGNQFERYGVDPAGGAKWYAPPSVAPGGSESGFKLYYKNLPLPSLIDTEYVTHVLAVDPDSAVWDPDRGAWGYTGTTVCLPGFGNNSTWWDAPTPGGQGGGPEIPEAGALLMGLSGLGGIAALRRFRK